MNVSGRPVGRFYSLPVAGRTLSLPCFFPSVSSVKTNLTPMEYVQLLGAVGHPQFLLSAFDVDHSSTNDEKTLFSLVEEAGTKGISVLLDSGNYERFWMRDEMWSVESFWSVLRNECFPLAFSYDQYCFDGNLEAIVESIEKGALLDQSQCLNASIIPIVHAPPEFLPDLVAQVSTRLHPLMIAVAERELGEGLFARAQSVLTIRKALDSSGAACPLHLLGTGNPLSILIYSLCGADSFDGLEWCQTAVDPETALLHHFHQRELSRGQLSLSGMEKLPYAHSTMVHNLVFYERWMKNIRQALVDGNISDLIARYLPKHAIGRVQHLLSEAETCDLPE